ncbi:hypothetical protein [Selenomonas sp. AE3005]|uniref:hypothetical protein n=1 Tax=Selenomonas sp. AE3005 TaxID=1485543 RepID=UPI0025FECFB4|nr:hypothetical protein [Selenomonas sp. AE3005]
MCKECGCGHEGGANTRLQFIVHGYTEESAQAMEKELLGLPGVLYVHIHAHDGETTVDYNPEKTKLGDILQSFSARGLEAVL